MEILDLCENKEDKEILRLLFEAHEFAAERNESASSNLFKMSCFGSGDFDKAVIAAIAMTGNLHAPIKDTRRILFHTSKQNILDMIDHGEKIPGFGNSFYKDGVDPSFIELNRYIRDRYFTIYKIVPWTQEMLRLSGKILYPNAALYTAIVAEIIGFKNGAESFLFIYSRLPIWAKMAPINE